MSQILLFRQAKAVYKCSKANLLGSAILAKSSFNVNKKNFSSNNANNVAINEFKSEVDPVALERKYQSLTTVDLYNWQLDRNTKKSWVIHDLPLAINTDLNLNHFYNKVLKDIINRYKVLKGFKIDFSLGFGCYGEIIENIAMREEMQRVKVLKRYTDIEIREITRQYVFSKLKEHIMSYQSWGLMADLRSSYLTMSPSYEASVLEVFSELMDKKLIYRDGKPFFWSVNERRAIPEEEIGHKYEDKTGYFLKFKVSQYGKRKQDEVIIAKCPNLNFVVFHTDLWTLTGCKGIAVNPNLRYFIAGGDDGEQYLIAAERYPQYEKAFKKLGIRASMEVSGTLFLGYKVKDPLYGKEIPVCLDTSIRNVFGSGINSVCPAHVINDLEIAQNFGLNRDGCVDEKGLLTAEAGDDLVGKGVVRKEASDIIREILEDSAKLLDFKESTKTLVSFQKKTKEELIIRTSNQWFCTISDPVSENFLRIIQNVNFVGSQAKTFIKEIEESKKEWCISSESVWGIPIPVFYVKGKGQKEFLLDQTVINYLKENFEKYGSDIWWKWTVMDLLPPKYKSQAENFEKGNLMFDHWFETGCAWYAVLCKQIHKKPKLLSPQDSSLLSSSEAEVIMDDEKEFVKSKAYQGSFPADLIVEGVNENKGLSLSSSLISANLKGYPPFSTLKNHPVLSNKRLESVNKATGNKFLLSNLMMTTTTSTMQKTSTEQQQNIVYGSDNSRLWAASADNPTGKEEDLKLETYDFDVLKVEIDMIRKIYEGLLKNTQDFKITTSPDLSPLDQSMIAKLQIYLQNIEKSYGEYNLSKVYQQFRTFMGQFVLNVFLETGNRIQQDTKRLESFQWTCAKILESTLITIAPILCHNAEDIYSHISYKELQNSVFQSSWPVSIMMDQNEAIKFDEMLSALTDIKKYITAQYHSQSRREVHFLISENDVEILKLLLFLGEDLKHFLGCNQARILRLESKTNLPIKPSSAFRYNGKLSNKPISINIEIYEL